MTDQHPITPPPELVQQLSNSPYNWLHQITNAYQAGADMELEACCEWLDDTDCEDPQEVSLRLRWHRRPKPPSLKEQALAELGDAYDKGKIDDTTYDTIRKALEALPND